MPDLELTWPADGGPPAPTCGNSGVATTGALDAILRRWAGWRIRNAGAG